MINILNSAIFFHIYVSFCRHTMMKLIVSKIYCKSIIRKTIVPHQYEDTDYCLDDWCSFYDREQVSFVCSCWILVISWSLDFYLTAFKAYLPYCAPALCLTPHLKLAWKSGIIINIYNIYISMTFPNKSNPILFSQCPLVILKCTRPFEEVTFQL